MKHCKVALRFVQIFPWNLYWQFAVTHNITGKPEQQQTSFFFHLLFLEFSSYFIKNNTIDKFSNINNIVNLFPLKKDNSVQYVKHHVLCPCTTWSAAYPPPNSNVWCVAVNC